MLISKLVRYLMLLLQSAFAAGLVMAIPGHALAQRMIARTDASTGLPEVVIGGVQAMKAEWAFWGSKWDWAGMDVEPHLEAPLKVRIKGNSRKLGLDLLSRTQSSPPRSIALEFEFSAMQPHPDVIGGGLLLRFDLATFGLSMGDPEIAADKRGISWGRSGGPRFEWRFESPLAAIYKERGASSEIRVFFYNGKIDAGDKLVTSVISVAGDLKVEQSLYEKFGTQNSDKWPISRVGQDYAGPDLSFLNVEEKPAGRRGFIKTDGEKLVFSDGTIARFWGTNLTAFSLFETSPESVRQAAKRLSAMGYNLVRLHHHDSGWVIPNVFGTRSKDTQTLDEAALERYDWWVKCLKEEGIYVWIDLHVGRAFTAQDRIDHFIEISKGNESGQIAGENYINASVKKAFKRYNEQFLSRRNKFTGLSYADEPAIIGMLLTNENDVTHHFGNAFLADKNVPRHHALMRREAELFAAKWGLPAAKVMRLWEGGPSKLFLSELENRFNEEAIRQLRDLGVKVPIATTNYWGSSDLYAVPALTQGSLIDAHAYGRPGFLEVDPSQGTIPLHWLAPAQVQGMPFTVSEWNIEPFPSPDRHALPLMMAAWGAFQGWDAMMQYAHAQASLNSQISPSNWHSANDPSLLVTLPAAALIYRRSDISESKTHYVFAPSSDQLFRGVSPAKAGVLREASERGKLTLAIPPIRELPWLKASKMPQGATVIREAERISAEDTKRSNTADAGQFRRNWDQGTFFIDTPRAQAAAGWIQDPSGQSIKLSRLEVASKTRNASVVVQSLSNAPIERSNHLLISIATQSQPKQARRMPFVAEPFAGSLRVRAPPGLLAQYSGHSTLEAQPLTTKYEQGWYILEIDPGLAVTWIVLRNP